MELKHTQPKQFSSCPVAFNCTLWNWNIWVVGGEVNIGRLLIVPYGIETVRGMLSPSSFKLLIVPYGIETNRVIDLSACSWSFNCTLWNWNEAKPLWHWKKIKLLIVPYGIETPLQVIILREGVTFNCTLWNWNEPASRPLWIPPQLLIVPYGIETAHG